MTLLTVLRKEFPEIIRAKGFYWTDENPDKAGFLSMAANILRLDYIGDWFAVLCEQENRLWIRFLHP
jgi:G3E family GTPase